MEDLLTQRGVTVSYETIRHWCQTFGLDDARKLRRRRDRLADTWYLDDVFVPFHGRRQYLWPGAAGDGRGVAGSGRSRWRDPITAAACLACCSGGASRQQSLPMTTTPSHRRVERGPGYRPASSQRDTSSYTWDTWEEIDEAGGVIRLSPARSKTLVGRILPNTHTPLPRPSRDGWHAATLTARWSSTATASPSAASARHGAPPARRPACRPASCTIAAAPPPAT